MLLDLSEMSIYAEKMCNMRILLQYTKKIWQRAKYAVIAYFRKTDMPILTADQNGHIRSTFEDSIIV